jgi:hypothetical protein
MALTTRQQYLLVDPTPQPLATVFQALIMASATPATPVPGGST